MFTHSIGCVCCKTNVHALYRQVREERSQRASGQPVRRPCPGLRHVSGRRQPSGKRGE